jgi:zinc D-Ala-D-Ala carboxypeptidase
MRTDDSSDARVAQILAELGIPASYGIDRHLPQHAEAKDLVSVGLDIHGRDRQLTPHAAGRWTELRAAAHQDGIALLLVSAFRSLEYQRQIFERKLKAGEPLERILKVNTPPGFSEHHTGRAVDLTTPGCQPLEEEFETTAAFGWLIRNAHRFAFAMTYPRENRFGMAYEPWHWAVQDQPVDSPPQPGRSARRRTR